ncbi:MAG: zinc ribbon domain-containing protein [Defluviitaleaceae bacterium]|nr:zinc ribbon domain-containing protein [Defluviitaleaceae bacterium]MCL2262599.1 zinc ribbon domain-containing protein [Defluviitaleaceae bacterium]
MNCTHCGYNFEDEDVSVCPECGAKVETSEPSFIPPPVVAEFTPPSEADDFLDESLEEVSVIDPENPIDRKKTVMFAAIGGGLVAIVAIILAITALMPHNPPYEVISHGRYDGIRYAGNGRFVVASGFANNERWGIYDYRGREIIPFGRFDAFETFENYFLVYGNRAHTVFDQDGREVAAFDVYDAVQFASPERFIVRQGNRNGVVDRRGREVIPMGRYSQIHPLSAGAWYIVNDGDRVGLVNHRGREIVSPGRFDSFTLAPNDRFVATIGSGLNQRVAVLNNRGNEIISLGLHDAIYPVYDSNMFIVMSGGTWGVIDHRGRTVVPSRYDGIYEAGETGFITVEGERVGVLDRRGNEIISPGNFDDIFYAGYGLFIAERGTWADRRVGVVNRRGEEIIQIGRYDSVEAVGNNRFIIGLGDIWDLRLGVVDHRGNEIIQMGRFDAITPMDYGFLIRNDVRIGFLCLNGQEIIPMGRYDRIHGVHGNLAIVTRDDRHGVVNTRRIR